MGFIIFYASWGPVLAKPTFYAAHLRKCKKYEVLLCTRIFFAPSLLDDRDHTRRLSTCRRSAVGLFDGFNSTNRACWRLSLTVWLSHRVRFLRTNAVSHSLQNLVTLLSMGPMMLVFGFNTSTRTEDYEIRNTWLIPLLTKYRSTAEEKKKKINRILKRLPERIVCATTPYSSIVRSVSDSARVEENPIYLVLKLAIFHCTASLAMVRFNAYSSTLYNCLTLKTNMSSIQWSLVHFYFCKT